MSFFFCIFVRLLCASMNRRKILYLFCCLAMVAAAVVSCKKHTYDFTFSPSSPKTGQTVTFTNTSDAGENWVWKFGDGSQSTAKNPTHIYRTAGTYIVEMKADSNNQRVISHVLEVLDSIPTIYVKSETVPQYSPVTIKASYYSPSTASVSIEWSVDEDLFVLTKGDMTGDSITGYFNDYGKTTKVGLVITIAGKTTEAYRTLTLVDNEAASLVMQTADGKLWRQRIYDGIYETVKPYSGDPAVIEAANDSTATLNGVTYDIHDMPVLTDKEVDALQVDAINRKLYVIMDDGVYVANANGEWLTQVMETEAQTLLLDAGQNAVYWSDNDGIWTMPLVTNPQNTISDQLREKIRMVNTIGDVQRMLVTE